jgi:hypothetical protein
MKADRKMFLCGTWFGACNCPRSFRRLPDSPFLLDALLKELYKGGMVGAGRTIADPFYGWEESPNTEGQGAP